MKQTTLIEELEQERMRLIDKIVEFIQKYKETKAEIERMKKLENEGNENGI